MRMVAYLIAKRKCAEVISLMINFPNYELCICLQVTPKVCSMSLMVYKGGIVALEDDKGSTKFISVGTVPLASRGRCRTHTEPMPMASGAAKGAIALGPDDIKGPRVPGLCCCYYREAVVVAGVPAPLNCCWSAI